MLKRRAFLLWIVAGLFLLLVAPTYWRTSFCPPQLPKAGAVKADGSTNQHQDTANAGSHPPVAGQPSPANQGSNAAPQDDKGLFEKLLCEDTKLTDWALVFFTYSLVVVGAFTMRSGEAAAENVERAYVFPGHEPIEIAQDGTVSVQLRMTNIGRMPARIIEVGYQFRMSIPTKKQRGVMKSKTWTKIPFDYFIPNRRRHKFEEIKSPLNGEQVFVAYILYEDIFARRVHTSWMCMKICRDGNHERAGGDAWNEWN